MSNSALPTLCNVNGCRHLIGHRGNHDPYPTSAWRFMDKKDRDKLNKAGFATPRGGAKGAYQNHVGRSNQVIIPYERLADAPLAKYRNNYVVRLYPEQYFDSNGQPKPEFQTASAPVVVGRNAFVLYRTHEGLYRLPPLTGWIVRHLEKNDQVVAERGRGVQDVGHYVLRIAALSPHGVRVEGAPQGVFAPEYANQETNYLCQCVLAWLIVHTVGSPYTTTQAEHLRAILTQEGLLDSSSYHYKGVIRGGLCSCPLCLRLIRYEELHNMVTFEEVSGVENAAGQVEGATRSTIVNLFHLEPLTYDDIAHIPANVAWGHAVCNTRLGQRRCISLAEIIQMGSKVGIIKPEGIETFGWISDDWQMIRSPKGAVWIQLNGDMDEDTSMVQAEEANFA